MARLRMSYLDANIGNLKKPDSTMLVGFKDLPRISPDTFKTIVVLTGMPPLETYPQHRKEEHEQGWQETRTWLLAAAEGKNLIELRLAGRRRLLDKPDLVVDGWQVKTAKA